jgi:putative membrane protein
MGLNENEKELISKEIENLEKLSSAELVAVIAKKSSDYRYASLMISIFLVFLTSFVLFFIKEVSTLELLQYQLLIFMGTTLIFEKFDTLILKILPQSYKHQKASLYAKEQFNNLGLNRTKSKQAIMFFVSLNERYVEIITDSEISKEIPDDFWQQLVYEFTEDVKNENFLNGYLKAIKTSKAILIKHFPSQTNDENELSNEIIELT